MKFTTITDREFGEITLLERSTAKHLIFRIRYGSLSITHPCHTRIDIIRQSIEEKRADLRKLFQRAEGHFLQPGDIIYTRMFIIMISCDSCRTISSRLHDNTLHIVLPQLSEYNDKNIQKSIAKHIHRHLKNSVAGEAEHDGTDTAFDHDAEESAHQRAFGGLTGFVVVAPLVALHEITADPRAHESADERAKAKQQGKPRQSADKRAKQARPHAAGARTVFLAPPALRNVLDDLPE